MTSIPPDKPLYGAILCAGKGTRLSPLTDILPKPLIPFLNTPLIVYALNHLCRANIQRIGINLHHLADAIPPVVDQLAPSFGFSSVYVREWELMGSGGGLRGVMQGLIPPDDDRPATIVALNGDSIMNIDLATHIARHHARGAQVTLVTKLKSPDQPGRVWIDEQQRLVRLRDHKHPSFIEGKTYQELDFTGVQIVERHTLARLNVEPCDIITSLYGPMLEAGEEIAISLMDSFWAAVDTPELLLKTQRRCLDDPALFDQAPLPDPLRPGMFIYRPGAIADHAKIAAPLLLGAHVNVEAQARIGPNVVADGVEILADAQLKNCMLYGMGKIEGQWEDLIAVAGKIVSL